MSRRASHQRKPDPSGTSFPRHFKDLQSRESCSQRVAPVINTRFSSADAQIDTEILCSIRVYDAIFAGDMRNVRDYGGFLVVK